MKKLFLLSWRHYKADGLNTCINLLGMTLGLAVVAIVATFIINELTYNSYFSKKSQIYRVLNHNKVDQLVWANTPFVAGEALKMSLGEVEGVARQYSIPYFEIKRDETYVAEENMMTTEPSFLSMFDIRVLQGAASSFEKDQHQILISASLAHKYFPDTNPIGGLMHIKAGNLEEDFEVAAIFEDLPDNTTIKASIISSIDFGLRQLQNTMISTGKKPDLEEIKTSWQNGMFVTNYLQIKKGVDIPALEKKISEIGASHSEGDDKLMLSLQPLADVYFGSTHITDNNSTDKGNISMLYIMALVGVLILLVACVNYFNLNAAKIMSGTKDMAVQKVCGASRAHLIFNITFESVFLSLLALPFALGLTQCILPFVSDFLNKTYHLSIINGQSVILLLLLLAIAFISGIFSGLPVAIRSSSLSLLKGLKGKMLTVGRMGLGIQHAMIVFQMAVFIGLITLMFAIKQQVHYAFTKDLGFKKEGLIRMPLGDHDYQAFKQELSSNPNVISVSGAIWIPPHKGKMNINIPKVSDPTQMVSVYGLFVDRNFVKTMGLKLLKGSDFHDSDNASQVLVNEAAVKSLGLTDVVGEQIPFGTIVGMVNDFNMYSIKESVKPMIIGLNPSICQEIAIRISTAHMPETMSFIQKAWENTGNSTFDVSFTDDVLQQLYESDIRFSKMLGLMSLVAILIASMGLFGLSLMLSRQRTKEIGVRKVNGARISEIMVLLNKDFIKWIVVAFVIAAPISWWVIQKWLEQFAYKNNPAWWIFALAGTLAIVVALLTVSWQSWKAATRNPVKALRYE